MSVGRINYGDIAAQELSERLAGYFATTTLLAALPAAYRVHGQMAVVGQTVYIFDENATVGGVAPGAGSGRWVAPGAGSATPKVLVARNMTTGALSAYTRTGNTIVEDANGALGAIDGVTNVVGDILFLNTGAAAAADVGLYAITAVGGASAKFAMTRIPEFDSSAEVVPGTIVVVAEGTANADTAYILNTNAPITLNTTSLAFTALPNYVDLAATGGAALIGSTGPSTVQADITARPTSVTLAAVGGAALIGTSRASTAEAELTSLIAEEVLVPLGSLRWNTGAAIAAFSDNTTDGFELSGSECLGIRWNNNTAPRITIAGEFHVPANWDDTAAITMHFEGFRVGSADAAMVLTVTAFAQEVGDAYTADDNAGGSTTAFDGATTVITDETLAFLAGVLPAGSKVSFTAVADAALDDDDFVLTGIRVVGSRALA